MLFQPTWIMQRKPLILLIALVLLSRLLFLDKLPLPVNHDELSNIYDAYCLAETGADRWGKPFPLVLRAFGPGDSRPPIYSWLTAPAIQLFGLSIISGRLIGAILSAFSIILVYLACQKAVNQTFGGTVLIILLFSPWHFYISRMAYGAGGPFLFLFALTIWAFFSSKKAPNKIYYWLLTGFACGLQASAYQVGKLSGLFLCICFWLDALIGHERNWKALIAFPAFAFLGALPQFLVMWQEPSALFGRAYATIHPPALSLDYAIHWLNNFVRLLLPTNLLPKEFFHFSSTLSFFFIWCFYIVTILGLIAGIWKLKTRKPTIYTIILLIAAIFPCAFVDNGANYIRLSCAMFGIAILQAFGFVFLLHNLKWPLLKSMAKSLGLLFVFIHTFYWFHAYFQFEIPNVYDAQQHTLTLAFQEAASVYQDHEKVIVDDDSFAGAYLYAAYYYNIPPQAFQKANKNIVAQPLTDRMISFDKFLFLSRPELQELAKAKNEKEVAYLWITKQPLKHKKPVEKWQMPWEKTPVYLYSF